MQPADRELSRGAPDVGRPSPVSRDAVAASTPAGKSCQALCDKELDIATDCPSDALGNCKAACDGLIPQLDSACRAKAQAAYDCVAQNTTSAACNGGNLPLPQTPDQCKTLVTEFVQCAP